MILRASLGVLIIGGALMGLYNILMTIYGPRRGE
jgi:hypothetical protein